MLGLCQLLSNSASVLKSDWYSHLHAVASDSRSNSGLDIGQPVPSSSIPALFLGSVPCLKAFSAQLQYGCCHSNISISCELDDSVLR